MRKSWEVAIRITMNDPIIPLSISKRMIVEMLMHVII